MLRYILLRRWTDPATYEVFRSFYTTTDPEAVERDLLGGGYGQGFDRTECIGIEVVDSNAALRSDGR